MTCHSSDDKTTIENRIIAAIAAAVNPILAEMGTHACEHCCHHIVAEAMAHALVPHIAKATLARLPGTPRERTAYFAQFLTVISDGFHEELKGMPTRPPVPPSVH